MMQRNNISENQYLNRVNEKPEGKAHKYLGERRIYRHMQARINVYATQQANSTLLDLFKNHRICGSGFSTACNIYTDFADYYDIYAHEFDYALWFKYLKTISGIANFKGKNVLDLGCGTGILLLKFAKEGAAMTGVDMSDRMLSITDQKMFRAKTKELLIRSDIADFVSGSSYDFIYSACDTVNYLNISVFEKLLINAGSMLKSGGRFAFDILNKSYFEYAFSEDEFLIKGVKYIFERRVNKDRLYTDVTIIDSGRVIKESHVQYFIPPDIIEKLVKKHNLTLCGIWDIYTQKPGNDESEKLQVLVQKA